MTHAEIAKILGVSSERVRQIERTAIAKLMHPKNRGAWKNIEETIAMIRGIMAYYSKKFYGVSSDGFIFVKGCNKLVDVVKI